MVTYLKIQAQVLKVAHLTNMIQNFKKKLLSAPTLQMIAKE